MKRERPIDVTLGMAADARQLVVSDFVNGHGERVSRLDFPTP